MSERRAKQARRLERLARTGRPERQQRRLPKHAAEPGLVGWVNEEDEARRVKRAEWMAQHDA